MVIVGTSILIFFIVILSLFYLLSNHEKKSITPEIRSKTKGNYISLSDGLTHYQIIGPDSVQTAILIHGMTMPIWTWDFQVPALVKAGFRVLMYDQYGRGYSDRPHIKYDRELYLRQLHELLDALKIDDKLHLIGASMGGAIAINFAAHFPQRAQKIVLFSPLINGGPQRAKIFRPKLVGEFLMRVIGISFFTKRCVSYYEGTEHVERYERLFKEQISYNGFEYSLLNLFRTDALGDYREAYSSVAKTKKPVLLFCGSADPEISQAMMNELKSLIPYTEAYPIEGAGHGMSVQLKTEKVNPILIDFLKKDTKEEAYNKNIYVETQSNSQQ